MHPITLEEAQRRLPELVRRAVAGERVEFGAEGATVEIVIAKKVVTQPSPVKSRLWELRQDMRLGDESIESLIREGRE